MKKIVRFVTTLFRISIKIRSLPPKVFLKKLISKAKFFIGIFILDKHTKRFIAHNKKAWKGWSNKHAEALILIDFYDVCETNIARSYFVNILAKKRDTTIKSFSWIKRTSTSLHAVYKSFNISGHIVPHLNKEQKCRKEAISNEITQTLKTKQDIFNLKVLDIWIGVDIYESYLRDFNKPTVYLDDVKLFNMIDEGIGLVIFWHDFFSKHKIAAVVASHDAYLRSNVVCKTAYQNKIPVYLPNPIGITYVQEPYSAKSYFRNCRQMFGSLSDEEQRNGIILAKKQLEKRLNGEVGVDMSYSTKSAFHKTYSKNPVLRKSNKIKVLICTHCFYDNPQAYGGVFFLDFYEWLCYLGKISEKTDYDWYIKMHPDALPGTEETIREIIYKFPSINYISPEISFRQLAKEGINFILTAYGSVGHECPALGIQVINAGYNPRVAYDFNWHPKSIEEYERYLLNLNKLHKHINLQDLYEFYYIFHYYVHADSFVFKSYRQFLSDLTVEQRLRSKAYGYFLEQLTHEKHQEIINNMERFIASGKQYYFSHGPE